MSVLVEERTAIIRGQGDKRFYVPGTRLHSSCPSCGKTTIMDLGKDYLSYPEFGAKTAVGFYCESCDHEWDEHVVVRVIVEAAK